MTRDVKFPPQCADRPPAAQELPISLKLGTAVLVVLAGVGAASFGLSHVLFAKSPGGVAAAASRTATFRALIENAIEGSGIDADLVEAIVLLESAGRPDVIAGHDPERAA